MTGDTDSSHLNPPLKVWTGIPASGVAERLGWWSSGDGTARAWVWGKWYVLHVRALGNKRNHVANVGRHSTEIFVQIYGHAQPYENRNPGGQGTARST